MVSMKNGAKIAKQLSAADWVTLMMEINELSGIGHMAANSPCPEEKIDSFLVFCAELGAFVKKHQQLFNRIAGMSDVVFKDPKDILWATCSQCRQTIVGNDCGICLHCQGVYNRHEQPDSWENINKSHNLEDLE